MHDLCDKRLSELVIAIKGAGEMASGVAWRLYQANLRRILMMEVPKPLAVRRGVSFCEAVHDGVQNVEGVEAVRVSDEAEVQRAWSRQRIAVAVDPGWRLGARLFPEVVVDAILAKRNLGTTLPEAPLVVALGPGFRAGVDAHLVIETNRGHHLGRVIQEGSADPDTGVPGAIAGHTAQRVLRAPADGIFQASRRIGDLLVPGQVVGRVGDVEVAAPLEGVLRGLIRSDTPVRQGLKIGDIDPRGDRGYCFTVSDKARAIAGSVLEAILRVYNG